MDMGHLLCSPAKSCAMSGALNVSHCLVFSFFVCLLSLELFHPFTSMVTTADLVLNGDAAKCGAIKECSNSVLF